MTPEAIDLLFASYGIVHASMLALTVIGCVVVVRIGRAHRGTDRARRFSRAFSTVLLVVTLGFMLLWLLPPFFDLQQSLPLHFSDALRFLAAWALWSGRRLPVAVTYFWGLTFNIQSLLTPDLNPMVLPVAEFASYWVQHILVMWAMVYLAWGLGLGPRWRDYRMALVFTVCFSMVGLGVNALLGTNYGYLNGPPASASALDLLGGWPTYLPVILVIMITAWALMTWPWTRTAPARAAPERAAVDA